MDFRATLSLGSACETAHQIRRNFPGLAAGPFDWLITTYDGLIGLIESDFEKFLVSKNLTYIERDHNGDEYILDGRYGTRFIHDFPLDLDFMRAFDEIKEKYDRRIDRWRETMKEPGAKLFVRSSKENNLISSQQAAALLSVLASNYRRTEVHLLIITPPAVPPYDGSYFTSRCIKPLEPFDWHGDNAAWATAFTEARDRASNNYRFDQVDKTSLLDATKRDFYI